ncbi:MAG: TonB family protein [Candidatus Zixiibacteriota bacterium]|nr:MAG: TonB family protein [candidate division Zixibacteria bacterium]
MNGCDKIESLLWASIERTLSESEKALIEKHLSECEKCREVRSTIEAIAESKKADEKIIASVGAEAFETAVFQKIRARESELRFKREEQGYMFRLYFSVGLAAAIVAFMVLSLGDLERYVMPIKFDSYRSTPSEKRFDAVQVILRPSEPDEPGKIPVPPSREQRSATDEKVMKIMPPPAIEKTIDTTKPTITAMAEEEPVTLPEKELKVVDKDIESGLTIVDAEPSIDKGMTVPELLGKKARVDGQLETKFEAAEEAATGDFSILSRPVYKAAPESVVINSIYLSDESIPIFSQQMRAFLPEVVVDSGIIQAVETPHSILVTVDKMPVPIKVVPPEYPVWARKNGISGVVWVKARVDQNGNVENAEIISSSMPGYGFEEASLEAARQCLYIPAEANGFKIGIWVIYPVKFIFKNNNSD